MVEVFINDIRIEVPENTTILEACKKLNIFIPTLCYHPDQSIKANCRLCIVEIEGIKELKTSCSTKVQNNMKIFTNSNRVRDSRKVLLELILANHDYSCTSCNKNLNCELQKLCNIIGVEDTRYKKNKKNLEIDNFNPSIVRDPNKCIKCGRCIEVCKEVQGLSILGEIGRSNRLEISPFNKRLSDSSCTYCGQCVLMCPVGAITIKNDINLVFDAINNKKKHVIVQVAPAVRVSIGELFNLPYGSITTEKLVACLKLLGFDKVFDTTFSADLTIIEESFELFDRIKNKKNLPMITSCSPGWINYVEQYYPELLEHISTCKSPQQMFGALAKNYYSEKENIAIEDIFVVSIMPCTAKKFEAKREEMKTNNFYDVDVVLTTVEIANMIKQSGIDFNNLNGSEFDSPFGISTGSGVIFGNTGGVMEAALRTTYELITRKELENIEFADVRGLKGIKEANIKINDTNIKVAVIHTLSNAKKILENIKNNTCDYTFIEVMACPGGCIGGGGQPYTTNKIRQERINSIYEIDRHSKIRKSHENEALKTLYKEYLINPLSEKSHKLLHTKYVNRKK